MKAIIVRLNLIVAVVIAAFLYTGCGGSGSGNAAPGNANTSANTSNTSSSTAPSDSSAYPPLATAVAQGELEALDGTKFKPADRKGSVLLMNMWGVWCGPCRTEMPHLVEMQNKYRDQGFQVIGLNVGDEDHKPESIDKIKQFAGEMKLNYELVRAPQDVQEAMVGISKFDGVPQSVLVDRNGRLRGVFLGGGLNVINKMKETVDKVVNEQ
jgi:thiol-disulfide isomerase/thioredoxin